MLLQFTPELALEAMFFFSNNNLKLYPEVRSDLPPVETIRPSSTTLKLTPMILLKKIPLENMKAPISNNVLQILILNPLKKDALAISEDSLLTYPRNTSMNVQASTISVKCAVKK